MLHLLWMSKAILMHVVLWLKLLLFASVPFLLTCCQHAARSLTTGLAAHSDITFRK